VRFIFLPPHPPGWDRPERDIRKKTEMEQTAENVPGPEPFDIEWISDKHRVGFEIPGGHL
jgi:hypothetical protein